MATTYTHHRFAGECLNRLPEASQEACRAYPDIYQVACQGPDLLFYYHFQKSNAIQKQGGRIHERPARQYFSKAWESVLHADLKEEERKMALAYAAGALTHFLLDTSVHSYIEVKEEVSGASHNKIEAEWDAFWMRLDGVKEPAYYDRAKLIPELSDDSCRIIGHFYRRSSEKIQACLQGQRLVLHTFASKGMKRKLIQGFLRKTAPDKADLFCENEPDPRCADSNLHLSRLYRKSLDLVLEKGEELEAFLFQGQPFSSYFDRSFGVTEADLPIAILSLEEEREEAQKAGIPVDI